MQIYGSLSIQTSTKSVEGFMSTWEIALMVLCKPRFITFQYG
jgi:hypothetical protein